MEPRHPAAGVHGSPDNGAFSDLVNAWLESVSNLDASSRPAIARALRKLAVIHVRRNELDRAVELLAKMPDDGWVDRIVACADVAVALARAGRMDEARGVFAKAEELLPKSVPTGRKSNGLAAAPLAAAARVLGNGWRARSLFAAAKADLENENIPFEMHWALAKAHLDSGDPDTALKIFRMGHSGFRSRTLSPRHAEYVRHLDDEARLEQLFAFLEQISSLGDWDVLEAVESFFVSRGKEEVLIERWLPRFKLSTTDVEVRALLAMHARSETVRALALLSRRIEGAEAKGPDGRALYALLGARLDPKAAKRWIDVLARDAQALFGEANDKARFVAHLAEALALTGRIPEAEMLADLPGADRVEVFTGIALGANVEVDALTAIERALESAPDAHTMLQLGAIAFRCGAAARARKLFDAATRESTSSDTTIDLLISTQIGCGDLEGARASLEKWLPAPRKLSIGELVVAYARAGRFADALEIAALLPADDLNQRPWALMQAIEAAR